MMKKYSRCRQFVATVSIFLCAGTALAGTRTWTGAASMNWFDDANWQKGAASGGGAGSPAGRTVRFAFHRAEARLYDVPGVQ